MTFSTQDSYIMGTHESVDVLVEVVNLGEDAYESQAIIELPPEVDYINVQHIEVNYTAIPVYMYTIIINAPQQYIITSNHDFCSSHESIIQGQHLSCILKETEVNGAEVVMCDIGNPLPSAQKVGFNG